MGLTGCGDSSDSSSLPEEEPENLEYPVSIGDETIPARPEKVVSLSPALTELCFDMGYGDQITGVSDYCDWPESARNLPQLGTAQQPDLDAIRAEEPDVVITHTDLSENDLIALQQADIPVVVLSRARLPEDLKDLYVNLGRLLEGETQPTPLQRKMGEISRSLSFLCLSVCAVMFGMGLLQGKDMLGMFLTAVSLAVAAIPEGLPAIVTIVLAIRVMGIVLLISLMTVPAVTMNTLSKSFRTIAFGSAVLGALGGVAGLAVSYQWELPSGVAIIFVLTASLIVAKLLSLRHESAKTRRG